MILYNYNNISISRFGLIQKDSKKVIRFNILPLNILPKLIRKVIGVQLEKRKANIITRYNEVSNKSKVDDILEDRYHIENIGSRIKMFQSIYLALQHTWFLGIHDGLEDALELFKKYFKKDFEYTDLDKIVKKIEWLQSKHRQILNNLETPKNKDFDFLHFISRIEIELDKEIKHKKLKNLQKYVDEYIIRKEIKSESNV